MKDSTRRTFLKTVGAASLVPFLGPGCSSSGKRPNIIWIVAEDQSRHYRMNGEPLVTTPHIDRMAAGGTTFTQAMVTCPVCSPSRSALITGMYQTTTGTHHHRSGRGTEKIHLPKHVRLIPRYFKEAGYYTCLGYGSHVTNPGADDELAKTDYNFEWDPAVYDGNEWSGRAPDQPFFAQIMLGGGKGRRRARENPDIPHVDTADVTLPPYYPDHPVIREDWAAYLDTFSLMDVEMGQILRRLEDEGLIDNTVVFFLTDHGVSHARGKQYLYDEGIMVPLIVYGPGHVEIGAIRDDLVAHIDIAATSLHFAGIEIPSHLEARPLYGPQANPREYVVSARDRCDETVDRIRSVRTHDFKYIRNGFPQRPHLQPCVYKDGKPILQALREWHAAGKLNDVQETLFNPTRPEEELYDLRRDPWEIRNLAQDPQHRDTLVNLRGQLDAWIAETGDRGQEPEPASLYDSDMEAFFNDSVNRTQPERVLLIKKNIALHKQWLAEGK